LDIGEETKREFVEPQLIKCEEPLDKVTIAIYGGQTDSNSCNWFEKLFNLSGC
jgi:hypothetical protein